MLTWIEIDGARLRLNVEAFRTLKAPRAALMVVVKANAYGHGIEAVAPIVAEQADWLGVNSVDEALARGDLLLNWPVDPSRGITVNCVAPGFIATPMTDGLTDEQRRGILARVPADRLGTPDEIAAGVVYLASDEAAYVTGQTLHINGGMAMI